MTTSGFISRAACRGHRPSRFAPETSHSRPALVGRLLEDRDVARFIVAPSGYGKTFLAGEYAGTMHAWLHVFWINCQSPCFVRDLDAGAIVPSCNALDEDAALVVFDGVPLLGDGRWELLSGVIDKLLSQGCEVIVTCVPSCDAAGALQPDRLRLGALDLLLDDDELDGARPPDERVRHPASEVGPAERVPQLVWGEPRERAARFARGILGEEVPADVLQVTCNALVLQSGTYSELVPRGLSDQAALEGLAREYPHLGLDGEARTFEAARIDMKALAVPLKRRLPELAARRSVESPSQIGRDWAATLIKRGCESRACAVVRDACPAADRAGWAVAHAPELLRRACFFPLLQLLSRREGNTAGTRMRLDAAEAICRMVLGDDEGAVRCSKRNAFNADAPEGVRVTSQLVAARVDVGVTAERARSELEELVARAEGSEAGSAGNAGNARGAGSAGSAEPPSVWTTLARAQCASALGLAEMARFWSGIADAGVDERALFICASWLFGLHEGAESELEPDIVLARRRAERLVRARLAECVADDSVDYFAVSAGLSMEEAHARGMGYEGGPLGAGSLILLRRVEMSVLSQRRDFEESVALEQARRSDWAVTHPPATYRPDPVPAPRPPHSVPVLTLRLFGRFEVAVGDVPLGHDRFNRRNTRALLVLLAVNQGRELSRDAVSEAMWPTSSDDVAHKNFYTVWSSLRRALSLPDGTCPYLIRHECGCSLNAQHVRSDVERLDEICRELLFTTPDIERWSSLFSEVDRDFSCDLMPSETKNALIIRARNDYRTRLVDALVAAALNVVDSKNSQWAVWFARAAVGRDETREDAYVALMRAQISVNQRTAAMMTYLKCRHVLSEQLGIDPAPETTELYESLLDS